jgi:hypothetical protein
MFATNPLPLGATDTLVPHGGGYFSEPVLG